MVLVVIKGLGIGGAEKLISESVRLWDRDRFDYHVAYALPWKDQLVGEISDLGIPVTCFGSSRGMTPSSWLRLRRLIRTTGAGVVHAHLPAMGAVVRVISPVPVVYTEHNIASSYRRPVQMVNRITYRRNTAVTAVSQAVLDSIADYPGPEAVVVSNGVECEVSAGDAAAVRAELGIAPTTPLVVHVGNIRPHKGQANLVAAAALLSDRIPDVRIVSIGGEKSEGDLARVRSLASAAGVTDTLSFLGRRPDALAFTAAADVFANPSDFEGLPVAVLEAMALGTPVVATAVGGVPSIIDDTTGVLVPPRDPAALADGVASLLDDRGLASNLADAARKVVERDYSLESMVRTLEDIYAAALPDRDDPLSEDA